MRLEALPRGIFHIHAQVEEVAQGVNGRRAAGIGRGQRVGVALLHGHNADVVVQRQVVNPTGAVGGEVEADFLGHGDGMGRGRQPRLSIEAGGFDAPAEMGSARGGRRVEEAGEQGRCQR